MEFLSRSWSLSAMELSKALANTPLQSYVMGAAAPLPSLHAVVIEQPVPQPSEVSPPVSPRESDDAKELFLLHQSLDSDLLSNQQLHKNGLCKNTVRGKTMGRWLKDQKEKKKQELRSHNAQLHAAVSVAGVAAAIAALIASQAMSPSDTTAFPNLQSSSSKTSTAMASAAALVASHCVEIAEEMGADRDQILEVIDSAVNVRTAGDIMTLTAGAATALRGAATLRARQHKELWASPFALADEQIVEGKETDVSPALRFVSEGGELLKRTRKGALHWKQVSFYVNSSWQVVAKMKSKHIAGAFTKKKKCVVFDVYCDTPAWPQREGEDCSGQKAYFGIQTDDRVIEFECRSKGDKKMWTDGIRQMLHCRTNMT
ncbi:VAN3-binding protein isoform X1 [Telopea speciosissima]|uniref:VAN3-binding protein isoform X1 n=1 Tax=Telopea speciosissima TaxID=54955 RepID=UPI001CC62F41|nr:VAN3-binding protein isoform X1 [Telopea speciosissima]